MKNTEIFFFFAGDKDFFYSHPKLKKLEEIVVEHFKSWNGRSYLIASGQDKVNEKAVSLVCASFSYGEVGLLVTLDNEYKKNNRNFGRIGSMGVVEMLILLDM